MLLLAPILSHLILISCISFFDDSIFYGILIPFYYFPELFDKPIVTLNVIFVHNFGEMFISVLSGLLPVLHPKEVLEFFQTLRNMD